MTHYQEILSVLKKEIIHQFPENQPYKNQSNFLTFDLSSLSNSLMIPSLDITQFMHKKQEYVKLSGLVLKFNVIQNNIKYENSHRNVKKIFVKLLDLSDFVHYYKMVLCFNNEKTFQEILTSLKKGAFFWTSEQVARVYVNKKKKFQFYINVENTTKLEQQNLSPRHLTPILKADTKNLKGQLKDSIFIFNQTFVNYIPKVTTRLRFIRGCRPVFFIHNSNPKVMDRRIHKVVVQIDFINSVFLSIVCGSCRKLKNDCVCQKSHFMVRCFVNLTGRSNGVPIKLCIRKLGVLFSLLNLTNKEAICVLGYLILYDKLQYNKKQYIKYTDIKFTSKILYFLIKSCEYAKETDRSKDLLWKFRECV